MVHGYTRLVLRNPISGNIIKDVESENTFQSNVISKYLRNLGSGNASVLTNATTRLNPPWQEIVGGVLLFNKAINSSSQYMPADNTMIGNACYGVLSTGNPTEMGSYNSSESIVTDSKITQVYDFNTSQAIGDINCVCLTSQTGGYIGYGNAHSRAVKSTLKSFRDRQDVFGINPQYLEDDSSLLANLKCGIGNNVYGVSYDNVAKKVSVKKFSASVTQCSIFDGVEKDFAAIDVSQLHYDYVCGTGIGLRVSGGKIYICPFNRDNLANGDTYYYWEYNPADNTISEKSFTNPTSNPLDPDFCGITEDFITFAYGTGSAVYTAIFDRSNGTLISNIQISSTTSIAGMVSRFSDFGDDLCLGWLQDTDSLAIYNKYNNTFYPINATQTGFSDAGDRRMSDYYDSSADVIFACHRYGVFAYNNPLYLATINNLNSTFTKDSSKVMKVIYELEEA